MPGYADTIRAEVDRRSRSRASVCPRHGEVRNTRRPCGRSRACIRAWRAAVALRDDAADRIGPQTAQEPSTAGGWPFVAGDPYAGFSEALDRVRRTISSVLAVPLELLDDTPRINFPPPEMAHAAAGDTVVVAA